MPIKNELVRARDKGNIHEFLVSRQSSSVRERSAKVIGIYHPKSRHITIVPAGSGAAVKIGTCLSVLVSVEIFLWLLLGFGPDHKQNSIVSHRANMIAWSNNISVAVHTRDGENLWVVI